MAAAEHVNERTPNRGDRIELLQRRTGVAVRGTVFYSDQLQLLVKWDVAQGACGKVEQLASESSRRSERRREAAERRQYATSRSPA